MEIVLYEFSISIIGTETIPERDIRKIIRAIRELPLVEMLEEVLSSEIGGGRARIVIGGREDKRLKKERK